jgi:hypothetical protein
MLSKSCVSALLRPTARRLLRQASGTGIGEDGSSAKSTSTTSCSNRIVLQQAAIAPPIDELLEETAAATTSTTTTTSLFPWREKQAVPVHFTSNPFQFIWRWVCNTNIMVSLNAFSSNGERLVHLRDIAKGSKLAFESAVEGVFQHRLMQAHSDTVHAVGSSSTSSSVSSVGSSASSGSAAEAEATKADAVEKVEAPELHAILGKDLADFYQQAVKQHCRCRQRALTYRLQQVGVRITIFPGQNLDF